MEKFKGPRFMLFCMSRAGINTVYTALMMLIFSFYIPPKEKVSEGMVYFFSNKTFLGFATILGIIILFGRIIDIFTDPIVASLSDNSKSKFGRRRSFLMFSALPLAVCTALIFFPPVFGQSWINAIYLSIIVGLWFVFFTLYYIPATALIPELAHTEAERVKMTSFQAAFGILGPALVMIGGPVMIGILKTKGIAPVRAYQITVSLIALVGCVLLYLAVFVVDEKRFSSAKPSAIPLMKSIKIALSNKDFVILLIMICLYWYAYNTIIKSAIHVAVGLVKATETFAGTMFGVNFLLSLISLPLVSKLSRTLGKKPVMLFGLALGSIIYILISITGLYTFTQSKVWILVIMGVAGLIFSIFNVLQYVFISDICDVEFKKIGERREGMYFGIESFFYKINITISTFVMSTLFLKFGKDIANPLGIRMSFWVGATVLLAAFFVFLRYPEHKILKEARSAK